MAVVLFIAILSLLGCYRPYPPPRSGGVPASAVWVGGLDGGGWVICSSDDADHNACTIYDEEGRSQGPFTYKLRVLNRAARSNELRYIYLTGDEIGLAGGLTLTKISTEAKGQ
jgi:hypothetical protein